MRTGNGNNYYQDEMPTPTRSSGAGSDMRSQLEAALNEAREQLIKQDELLKRLLAVPCQFGSIIQVTDTKCVLTSANGVIEIEKPEEGFKSGDFVLISGQTGQIVGATEFPPAGDITMVKKIISSELIEIPRGQDTTVIFAGALAGKLEIGDRVMLDPTGKMVVRSFGQSVEGFKFEGATNIDWNDIGGLDTAKMELREAIEFPFVHADRFKFFNKKQSKGALLFGPPGCGKTLLVKAASTSLAKLHGKKSTETGFIYVKGPEILNKFVGTSEETIRSLFARGRKHFEKHGYPAILFIDEADAILRKRGTGRVSDMESTIVPAFLAEMDGLDKNGPIVILATNRPDTLDNAVTRDGRIDSKVMVPRPDASSAVAIFKIHLKGVPLSDSDATSIAKATAKELFSPTRVIYNVRRTDGTTIKFTLGNLTNGAMIAGIVAKASSKALRRDIAANSRKSGGVLMSDFIEAVGDAFTENLHLDHSDELSEFIEPLKDQLAGIDKMRQGEAG